MKNIIFTTIVLIVSISLIFGVNYALDNYKSKAENNPPKEQDGKEEDKTPTNEPPITPPTVKYDESPAKEGAQYFEKFPNIEGQQAYIAYPIEINPEQPPRLVVYNHGSDSTVTTNLSDPFMQDMQKYGEFFASRGYAFAASNQHGMNYGSLPSRADIDLMKYWIRDRYKIQEKIDLLGFSMGGLPALFYTNDSPENVNSIALLAPVTYIWGPEIYKPLENIPIKIWHGDKDRNVTYTASTGFIERGKPYNLNIELRTVTGAGHFDIDTEYMEEIYEFYEKISNE